MIGNIIKAARDKKELTQEQLAKSLYVDRTTVAKWERNTNVPRVETIKRIAEILEIPINSLINYTESKHTEIREMSDLNNRFINLQTLEQVQDFINDILIDFKFDKSNEETMKTWIANYVYATILTELENRDHIYTEEDEFDIYNLTVSLEWDALNGLFGSNFTTAYAKLFEFEANEREEAIARVYEFLGDLKRPTNLEITLLNLAMHIAQKVENKPDSIAGYIIKK